jgi:hypothetical protein
MLNQFITAKLDYAKQTVNRFAAFTVLARIVANGFLTTIHHTVMVIGVAAITIMCIMFFKPSFTSDLKSLSPFTTDVEEDSTVNPTQLGSLMDMPSNSTGNANSAVITPVASEINTRSTLPSRQQQILVSDWLSKRYRVAGDATYMLVSAAYLSGEEYKLDPLLILSVMAIESGFNPFAESPVGAQGLMQVMSKLHEEKFEDLGGVKAALNPVANIKVGSMILKDYVTRGGSVEAGLKLYVGAGAFDTDSGYGAKVLAEYQRLKEVSSGRKVSIYTTNANKAVSKPVEIDSMNEEPKKVLSSENKSISGTKKRTSVVKVANS